jgi:RNA polymerase sigma-70 factor (ECF subfamily)
MDATPDPASFDDLMSRLRVGDDAAAAAVFGRYARGLFALARGRLDARVRGKVDPEDVVQSVFKSFFARQADGRLDLADWGGVWTILCVITLRKCGHAARYYRRACRDVVREASPAGGDEDSARAWAAVARDPGPDEAAALVEAVEQAARGLDDEDRQVLALSLDGLRVTDISARLGYTERRVYRVLELVRHRLERMRDRDD